MPIVEQRPDFASNPDLLKRLIYSKYLFNRARLIQQEGNELASAEAILTAHNSVEMLIRVIADCVDAKYSEKFMQQLRLIEEKTGKEPPYTSAIDRLNSLRVNFKHKGNIPHPTNVAELIPVVAAFCSDATSQYLALDYEKVSLADLIQNAEAKAKVEEAVRAKNVGTLDEAVVAIRRAFDILHDNARREHKAILINNIPILDSDFPPPRKDFVFSLAETFKLGDLTGAVNQLVETVNGILLGIEPARFRRFSDITPFRFYSGFQRTVEYRWRPNRPALRPEDFDFCHQFVIDYALRLASAR